MGVTPIKCTSCDGRGVKLVVKQLGPGMIQQMQQVCPACKGKGEIVKDSDKCLHCKGEKVEKVKKTLEVFVEKGMAHGHKITFHGESDQAPGVEPGDMIFVVVEKKHDLFERKGNDLFLKKTLNLNEALCGFEFSFEHLDKRILVVSSEAKDIVKPNDVRSIEGEGMPIRGNPMVKGNLYIFFEIEFPHKDFFKPEILKTLTTLLPKKPHFKMPSGDHVEKVVMSSNSIKPNDIKSDQRNDEDEDEEQQHPGQATCAQQ